MIKTKLIDSLEISYVVVLLMEQNDGLLLLRGCVRDFLTPMEILHLVMNLEEVLFIRSPLMSLTCLVSYPPSIDYGFCINVAHCSEFSSPEGRRSVMKLSHRMVKNFCGILSMSGKLDFPQLSELYNSGIRVSVQNSREPGQPGGMIVSAATSLWLPLPPQNVFDFIREEKMRVQVNYKFHIIDISVSST